MANLSQGGCHELRVVQNTPRQPKNQRTTGHACFDDALNSNVFLIPMSEKKQKTWIVVAMVIVVVVADLGGHPSTSYSQPKRTTHPSKNAKSIVYNINKT